MPAEPRFRRAQAGVPIANRGLPGMPPSMDLDDDDDDRGPVRSRPRRFSEEIKRPWWRPATRFGRILLASAAIGVVFVCSICAYAVSNFLEHDARFRIAGTTNIQAAGLSQVSRADLLPVFGEDIGRNIFFVPIKDRRKQLEQIPWIEHASVMRFLPDQIRISVVERKPIAFVRQGAQVELIDANGVLLAEPAAMMSQHHYSFPVVTGIDPRDPITGRRARMEVYQRLVAELDSSNQHLSDQVSEIDLHDPEDARVLMPEQGIDIVAHFGEDHFLERFQRYKAHIAEWRQQYPKLAEVDLRYDQQVVLQMTDGVHSTPGQTAKLQEPSTALESPKPSPAKTEFKSESPRPVISRPVPVKHVQTPKPAKTQAAKSHPATKTVAKSSKSKNTKSKLAAKKQAKHTTTKKPAAKPHRTATAG
ncbi:MAG: FtsQ-type POTRA domain-containing protein [Acidobacteria bacterium]|nr:FtsQ-type POTRA domain-containing protein [Acidobacteriota bacterium]